jgi:hypothetical protein
LISRLAGGTVLRVALLIFFGLLLWLAAQFFSLFVAAGGHGWSGPLLATIPLIILYPLAIVRAFSGHAQNVFVGMAIIAIAILLDVGLLQSTVGESRYIKKVWQLGMYEVMAWLFLWIGWQVLAVYSLFRRLA